MHRPAGCIRRRIYRRCRSRSRRCRIKRKGEVICERPVKCESSTRVVWSAHRANEPRRPRRFEEAAFQYLSEMRENSAQAACAYVMYGR